MTLSIASSDTAHHTAPCTAAKAFQEAHEEPADPMAQRLFLAPWQERKAKAILERSLYTRLFIADVAKQCALSRSHFSRAFKKTTGLSPQEWCLHLRVRQAKTFLATGFMPLSQISLECGFADQSHFSRMFSRIVGAPPKRWQRLNTPSALVTPP